MAGQYTTALQIVDGVIKAFGLTDNSPQLLHHYTSLEAALSILEKKDVRLCHAEYLNDASEIRGAQQLIGGRIKRGHSRTYVAAEQQFYAEVASAFDAQARLYEAFVFCMAETPAPQPLGQPTNQDVLNAWRAYGKDGKGICLSFASQHLATMSRGATGTRLSKVIYDELLQERLIDQILDEGYKYLSSANSAQDATQATVAALIFMMPVMKNEAFKEEREWRFIYLPEVEDHATSKRKFYVRDGLLIPYYTFLDADPKPENIPPVAEIMVGPSANQILNIRSIEYRRGKATLRASRIPYRS